MSNEEILSRLSQLTIDPSESVYSITCRTVLTAIVQRMGIQALALSPEDLQLACEEVHAAIDHGFDYRPYIEEGLNVWEITRSL